MIYSITTAIFSTPFLMRKNLMSSISEATKTIRKILPKSNKTLEMFWKTLGESGGLFVY